MNALPQTTKRRLQKIPQIPTVWEGDRRPLSKIESNLESGTEGKGECIIWVDGSEGLVRAMDVVPPAMGPEAVVRTLLRAIENPHSPATPARPQKIVVRDREIQFFLRGALQNLDIAIEYVKELPLIDELFRGFEEISHSNRNKIAPVYEKLLATVAREIWEEAIWETIVDRNIIAIEIDRPGIDTLYACVMGMLGREYGIILYRSLDSMKRFRSAALSESNFEELETAFLSQDCWFLNFEAKTEIAGLDDEDEEFDLAELPTSEIRPVFGSIHPLEGMRPFLDEEEAIAVYIALNALLSFFRQEIWALNSKEIKPITGNYNLKIPSEISGEKELSVRVSTMPKVAAELEQMLDRAEEEIEIEEDIEIPIREDLVPRGSYCQMKIVPWELIKSLRDRPKIYYKSQSISCTGEGLPAIIIQTTRGKAKILIENIEKAGGIEAICFNPGEDPLTGTNYDIGIIKTGNGDLYLFEEFEKQDPTYLKASQKWHQSTEQNQGYCGIIVAMGVTGNSKGNPKIKDMIGLLEAKVISSQQLGMGILQLMPEYY